MRAEIKYSILFAVGKDRPGIFDDFSTLLFKQGVNIEDSRMAAQQYPGPFPQKMDRRKA